MTRRAASPIRLLLNCALLLVFRATAPAQRVKTSPAFASGQTYQLLLVETVEDVRDDGSKRSGRTPVTLRVVRNGTSGMDIDWVAGRPAEDGAGAGAQPLLEMAGRVFENLHIIVRLDADGKYAGLRNEGDVLTRIQEFVTLMVPQATAGIADPAARRRVADAITKAMTPQAMLSAARKEIDLYFGLSGLPLELRKPLRIRSSAMNPFGGKSALEAAMEITPVEVSAARGEARIEFRQQFNAGSAAQVPAPGEGASPPAQFTLEDAGEYVLDLTTGRVKRVRNVRTIFENGSAVRVETTEITAR